MSFDRYGQLRPSGDREFLRTRSDRLARTCPFSTEAANEDVLSAELFPEAPERETTGPFISAFVGYVAEGAFRERGSSGGMVSWVLDELLGRGLIDGAAHVVPVKNPSGEGRFFQYRISRKPAEIREGAKSRYYPVEASQILRDIAEKPGRYAVVGVPCFIKAVQLLRREDPLFKERIAFTLGLFCGHMKSARFVESFALQMGVPIGEVQEVEFRAKDVNRPASTYTAQLTLRDGSVHKRDWWNLVDGDWGSGFFMYEACNFCDDVVAETADISFGDAWVEPYSSDGRGTNVVMTRSAVVDQIVREGIVAGRLTLDAVDGAFVVETQAAGFRQRREGLSYRLTWPKLGLKPLKRVPPARPESKRRRFIYRTRALISRWSHRVFWVARMLNWRQLFTAWGRSVVAIYHGLAYSRGRLGALADRFRW